MSPTSYQLLHPRRYEDVCARPLFGVAVVIGTGDRGRTGTGITTHGILSPGRLPIPPRRRDKENLKFLNGTSDFDWLRGWGSNPQPSG